jgi:hypothetical protein
MTQNGILEVGINENGEVIINLPDLTPVEDGVGHIVFSVDEALNLARVLHNKAGEAALARHKKRQEGIMASAPPVDRSKRVLASGSPVPEDNSHTEIQSDGMQKEYVVLSADERSRGFVRPYRDAYRHLKCGHITTMGKSIAETYARDPHFYTGTFCSTCRAHFPIGEDGEFRWYEMNGTEGPKVGT